MRLGGDAVSRRDRRPPASLQVKLLRLSRSGVYEPLGDVHSLTADVRIVAATNRDLGPGGDEGAFRRDLYYRVNVIRLVMPPLRERPPTFRSSPMRSSGGCR